MNGIFNVRAKTRQVVDHLFIGGLGWPGRTVTREMVREVPAEPLPPRPIECPFCGQTYVPVQTNFTCPHCGAATPKEMLSPGMIQNEKASA